eukprot:215647_1
MDFSKQEIIHIISELFLEIILDMKQEKTNKNSNNNNVTVRMSLKDTRRHFEEKLHLKSGSVNKQVFKEAYDSFITLIKDVDDGSVNKIIEKLKIFTNNINQSKHLEKSDKNDVAKQQKILELTSQVILLHDMKLQITSLFEIKNHNDWKQQSKKEQSTIMQIVETLGKMKDESSDYFDAFSKSHDWVDWILSIFDNPNFKTPYDA